MTFETVDFQAKIEDVISLLKRFGEDEKNLRYEKGAFESEKAAFNQKKIDFELEKQKVNKKHNEAMLKEEENRQTRIKQQEMAQRLVEKAKELEDEQRKIQQQSADNIKSREEFELHKKNYDGLEQRENDVKMKLQLIEKEKQIARDVKIQQDMREEIIVEKERRYNNLLPTQ